MRRRALLKLSASLTMILVPFFPGPDGGLLLVMAVVFVAPHVRRDPRPILDLWLRRVA